MINRYQGNSGRVERFPESGEERRAPPREQIPRVAAQKRKGCSTGLEI